MQPLFIFSLPRSGSTLLQRMLMAHSQVSSVAEPWILLPVVCMYRETGVLAEYSQATCRRALRDLVNNTPGGIASHRRAIRNFAMSIYESLAKESDRYFLDKTPRYHYIIEDIAEIFPSAKFVFLFRNPVHVYASIIDTWNETTFTRIWAYKSDLENGPSYLSRGFDRLRERAVRVRYEDLVVQPHAHLRRICAYMDIEYEQRMVSMFDAQELSGSMGDHKQNQRRHEINAEGLDKWRRVFGDRFRRRILVRYIRGLAAETLSVQGYDKAAILREIESLPIIRASSPIDVFYYLRAQLALKTKANLFFEKKNAWTRDVYLS
jgi:hypothetical protein